MDIRSRVEDCQGENSQGAYYVIEHCLRDTGQPTDVARESMLYDTLMVVM